MIRKPQHGWFQTKMEDICKMVKSLEKSDLLIKDADETIDNKSKDQKRWFLSILLRVRTFLASLLGNLLSGKKAKATIWGWGAIRGGDGFILGCDRTFSSTSSFN